MIDTRLGLTLDEGGLDLSSDGFVAVVNASPDMNLGMLDRGRLVMVDGFKPHFDAWIARGFEATVSLDGVFSAVLICLPRSKSDARALIAKAMEVSDGLVVIDGQKTDGVDSILRDMRKRVDLNGPINKAHGKLFWCSVPDPQLFADWQSGPALTPGGFWTAPGVFSADGIDPASAMLADALPDDLGRTIGDLGAGWGFLSAHVLTRANVEAAHLVEAGYMALECAKRNVTDPRAHFHWANALQWTPPKALDAVVMNPPFHLGRSPDPTIGQGFVEAAAAALTAQGSLWIVANRHLPYETTLSSCFAKVDEIGGDARFKLFQATRPLRKRARPT